MLIFGMWLSDTGQPRPERYDKYIASWREHNPTTTILVLNNADVESYMPTRWRAKFHSLERIIEKCDFARYVLMYIYGGLYLDLNMLCTRNLEPLFRGRDIALTYEIDIRSPRMANCYLYSARPQHPFWATVLDNVRIAPDESVLETTGPVFLAQQAEAFFGAHLGLVLLPAADTLQGGYLEKVWTDTACWGAADCGLRYWNWAKCGLILLLIVILVLYL